jgi:acyl-CoA dehydrogenase
MHTHLVATQVWQHRHRVDVAAFLRQLVEDRVVLVTTVGSDWIQSNGQVRRVDGGFCVRARKAPASGCEIGDVVVTSFRWDDAPEGPTVVHCALPLTTDGIRVDHTWDTLGLRATGSHTLVFDDVFVPDAAVALTRPADRWHPAWNVAAGAALPLIMAAYTGIADTAVDIVCDTLAMRTEPYVAQLVGEMLNAHTTAVDTVTAMLEGADDLRFDATDAYAARTMCRKSVAAEAVVATVRLGVEAVGGAAYSRTSPLERLLRDAIGCLFHPLSRAKQTQFSGRVATGRDPVA